jgi:hypothetical protein
LIIVHDGQDHTPDGESPLLGDDGGRATGSGVATAIATGIVVEGVEVVVGAVIVLVALADVVVG